MKTEVEVKARWNGNEIRLEQLGAVYDKTVAQKDTYFQHPCRDFRETDEAVRIRDQDGQLFLTYKGPKLDDSTKSRMEYEIPVDKNFENTLTALGFKKAVKVAKTRKNHNLDGLTVCLDDVEGLGLFIEIESDSMDDRDKIFSILEKLGIQKDDTIRESYTELLEAKN